MTASLRKSMPVIVWAALTVAGCRSAAPPAEFYALTPLNIHAASEAALLDDSLAVGIGPLVIPKMIDRPQIVQRTGPNKIRVDEFHRWAGELHEDFLQVLATNLTGLLQTNLVAAYPWEDYFEPDYRIFIDVRRFDGELGQDIVLDVTWTVTGGSARDVLLVRRSMLQAPVAGMEYSDLVAANSGLLADLSREMAREIKILHRGRQ